MTRLRSEDFRTTIMNHCVVLLQWNFCWATPTDKYHVPTGELRQNYTSRMLEQYKQAPRRVMNWTVHWHYYYYYYYYYYWYRVIHNFIPLKVPFPCLGTCGIQIRVHWCVWHFLNSCGCYWTKVSFMNYVVFIGRYKFKNKKNNKTTTTTKILI